MSATGGTYTYATDSRTNRKEKEDNIAKRAPRAARDATSAKQLAHIVECHTERTIAADSEREASRSQHLIAELDDKLVEFPAHASEWAVGN